MDEIIDLGARLHRKSRYLNELRRAIDASEEIVRVLEDHAKGVALAGGVLPEEIEEALVQRVDPNVAVILKAVQAVEKTRQQLARLDTPLLAAPGAPNLMVLTPSETPLEEHPSLRRTTDTAYRRRVRIQQARWRDQRQLPPGEFRGKTDLATLSMPAAQMRLDNFITGPIRNMVRRYALGSKGANPGYGERFFTDLLDTRALAFNLFGELARDTELATSVFRDWVPDLDRVLRVDLDYRPSAKRLGRVLHRDWRAPLHACVNYVDPDGELGFVGCVILYAEPRRNRGVALSAQERSLLTELATLNVEDAPALERSHFSRLGRAYLTCGGLLHSDIGYRRGQLWAIHAGSDQVAHGLIEGFSDLLSSVRSFKVRNLESLTDRIGHAGRRAWADAFRERYLSEDA